MAEDQLPTTNSYVPTTDNNVPARPLFVRGASPNADGRTSVGNAWSEPTAKIFAPLQETVDGTKSGGVLVHETSEVRTALKEASTADNMEVTKPTATNEKPPVAANGSTTNERKSDVEDAGKIVAETKNDVIAKRDDRKGLAKKGLGIDEEEDDLPRSRKTVRRFEDELGSARADYEKKMRQAEALVKAASAVVVREIPHMNLPPDFAERLLARIKASRATPDQRAACEFYCSYYLKPVSDDV